MNLPELSARFSVFSLYIYLLSGDSGQVAISPHVLAKAVSGPNKRNGLLGQTIRICLVSTSEIFLVSEKSALQIFILPCKNFKSEPFSIPEILRWGYTGRFCEKRDLTY